MPRDETGQGIHLNGRGFLPDEDLIIQITGKGPQHSFEVQTQDFRAGQDGSFSLSEKLPLDDPEMQWEIHVVHQRGTACLAFTTRR